MSRHHGVTKVTDLAQDSHRAACSQASDLYQGMTVIHSTKSAVETSIKHKDFFNIKIRPLLHYIDQHCRCVHYSNSKVSWESEPPSKHQHYIKSSVKSSCSQNQPKTTSLKRILLEFLSDL